MHTSFTRNFFSHRKIFVRFKQIHRNFNWYKFPTPTSSTNTETFYKHLDLYMYEFNSICPYEKFNIPGIYKLTNRRDGKVYIGMSLNMRKRLRQHFSDAFRYKYDNCSKYLDEFSLVSKAVAENDFDFDLDIVETIPQKQLLEMSTSEKKLLLKEREKLWIDKLQSHKRELGYNIVK